MNKYPIGGFAPGDYMNSCLTCDSKFIGDKGAWQCEACATEASKPTAGNKAVFDCIVAKTMFGSVIIISGKRNLEESTTGFYEEPLEVLLDGIFFEDNGLNAKLFSDKDTGVYSCKMMLTVSGGYTPGDIGTEYTVSLNVYTIEGI